MNEHSIIDPLAEAFASIVPITDTQEFRIYYDPFSKSALFKTASKEPIDGEFVTVDRETYEGIAFCPNYLVKNGKIELKPLDFGSKILLELKDNGYPALKGYNMFVATTGDIEHWTMKD